MGGFFDAIFYRRYRLHDHHGAFEGFTYNPHVLTVQRLRVVALFRKRSNCAIAFTFSSRPPGCSGIGELMLQRGRNCNGLIELHHGPSRQNNIGYYQRCEFSERVRAAGKLTLRVVQCCDRPRTFTYDCFVGGYRSCGRHVCLE
jgi:hypothetical protein